jgi:hypothetical protein
MRLLTHLVQVVLNIGLTRFGKTFDIVYNFKANIAAGTRNYDTFYVNRTFLIRFVHQRSLFGLCPFYSSSIVWYGHDLSG